MAMEMKTEGMAEVIQQLTQLGDKAHSIAAGAVYDGAGVVADAFTVQISSIKTKPKRFYAVEGHFQRLPTEAEKKALTGNTGIAKFRKDDDGVDTLVGFANGYTEVDGKQKPIIEIARSINSGTSFMKKQPFVRKIKSKAGKEAETAMVRKAEEMIRDITKA